jgi:hypothetical protein
MWGSARYCTHTARLASIEFSAYLSTHLLTDGSMQMGYRRYIILSEEAFAF